VNWTPWITTLEFGIVHALFALSTFAALWSGVLSLAAVSFGAFAGFSYVFLAGELGISLIPGLLLGAALGALFAWLVSLVFLQLSSHYLAMATIALVLITRVLVVNLPDVTGGAAGIGVTRHSSWWWLVIVLALVAWILHQLRGSRLGLATECVREDPAVAQSLGIDPRHVQRIAFALSGALGGVGGVLFADLLRFIGPNSYYVDLAFVMLASVVLGGAYHWAGSIVGALVFTALPEVLHEFIDRGEEIANGIILIVIMIYLPRGFVDPARGRRRRARRAMKGGGGGGPAFGGRTAVPTQAQESGVST
jgi:branched-chain amino acid transport system permease protein